jgi:hypothetical protein
LLSQLFPGDVASVTVTYTDESGDSETVVSSRVPGTLFMDIWRSIKSERDGPNLTVRFEATHRVKDRIRYYFSPTGSKEVGAATFNVDGYTSPIPIGVRVSPKTLKDRPILLILESPHVDEVCSHLQPTYPAAGDTGVRLDRNVETIRSLVMELVGNLELPVIICNPVQFPTSCRVQPVPTWWRNLVFKRMLLNDSIRDGFQKRLIEYDPFVIINACTSTAKPPPPIDGLETAHAAKSSTKKAIEVFLKSKYGGKAYRRYFKWEEATFHLMKEQPKRGHVESNPEVFYLEFPHPSSWT